MAWSWTIKLFGKQKNVYTHTVTNGVLHATLTYIRTQAHTHVNTTNWKKKALFFYFELYSSSKCILWNRWFYTWLSHYASCNTSCIWWWFFRFYFFVFHVNNGIAHRLISFWRLIRVWVFWIQKFKEEKMQRKKINRAHKHKSRRE